VKKLDTYLYREMVVPFLIGTLAVVMMFQINTYMALAKTLNLENVPFEAVLQYILYKTPEFLQMTLPVGMSLAASLAITRLARESELTAMRAAGIPILRVIRPVALFGLAVSALNFYDVEYVMPKATGKANTLAYEAGILGMSKQSFKANSLIELDHQAAYFGAVTRTADNKLTIDGITLFDRKDSDVIFITTADSATYDRGVWTFKNGYLYQFRGADMTSLKAKGDFVINERIVVGSLFENTAPEEMSMAELRQEIASRKKTGQNAKDIEIRLQSRFSVPVACAVFSVVSPIFAILLARSGGFVGVLVSFVSVLLYYNAVVVSTLILGKLEAVPVWFAAWSPNIIFAVLGLIALRRLE
jgi:lipopolysaccharide export system permease protein